MSASDRLRLWHFTCADHGRKGIGKRGMLLPNWHAFLGASLLWLTTEKHPDRFASGLGQSVAKCDRMAYRYSITDTRDCEPWLASKARSKAPAEAVEALESYGDPEHWWIATVPVPARLG